MIFPSLALIEEERSRPVEGLRPFSCAVLSNVTIDLLEPYLAYAARREGIDLTVVKGDFDNILQEAMGGGSGAVSEGVHAIVVALWLPAFSKTLGFEFAQASPAMVADEIARVGDYCAVTIRALRERSAVPILWMSFERPAWPAYGIADATMPVSHSRSIEELNASVAEKLREAGNAYLLDLAACQQRIGANNFYDWRYWHLTSAPFTREALGEMALRTLGYLRALTGRTKKCLVIDCDNTLWGGIVGEDGLDGIKLGDASHGSAYRDFQREIVNLYHRGVVLAVCSKNNLADVTEVFQKHPGMLLREEHIAVMRVNWEDKAANIRAIAAELNLGLDAMVFVDDSEFEANLVRSMLPEVEVLLVSPKQPARNWQILAECGLFDSLQLSEEDRQRGQMYRAEAKRKELMAATVDLSEYLRSLQMRIEARATQGDELERAAQLTQRTNQFNLTTVRLTRDELEERLASGEYILRSLRLTDRFGDYGTIGFALIRTGETAVIELFLMSCRALGRGVETAFLSTCVAEARKAGARTVIGRYVPSKKNGQVAGFFSAHGFVPDQEDGGVKTFRFDLGTGDIKIPEHFSGLEH
ncbi:HAD-IIIC family phosphatase [Steroidobacter flavus]|uniref:HAD-IIIC family phosphatase n=1 Tax=Steroidobacter flavus TaxID=1842136 RepID=A0ABV8T0K1_9GAMM